MPNKSFTTIERFAILTLGYMKCMVYFSAMFRGQGSLEQSRVKAGAKELDVLRMNTNKFHEEQAGTMEKGRGERAGEGRERERDREREREKDIYI